MMLSFLINAVTAQKYEKKKGEIETRIVTDPALISNALSHHDIKSASFEYTVENEDDSFEMTCPEGFVECPESFHAACCGVEQTDILKDCPKGSWIMSDGSCKAKKAWKKDCPEGYIDEGAKCTWYDELPAILACPDGFKPNEEDDRICNRDVTADVVECEVGQLRRDNKCFALEVTGLECPAGYDLLDDETECVREYEGDCTMKIPHRNLRGNEISYAKYNNSQYYKDAHKNAYASLNEAKKELKKNQDVIKKSAYYSMQDLKQDMKDELRIAAEIKKVEDKVIKEEKKDYYHDLKLAKVAEIKEKKDEPKMVVVKEKAVKTTCKYIDSVDPIEITEEVEVEAQTVEDEYSLTAPISIFCKDGYRYNRISDMCEYAEWTKKEKICPGEVVADECMGDVDPVQFCPAGFALVELQDESLDCQRRVTAPGEYVWTRSFLCEGDRKKCLALYQYVDEQRY